MQVNFSTNKNKIKFRFLNFLVIGGVNSSQNTCCIQSVLMSSNGNTILRNHNNPIWQALFFAFTVIGWSDSNFKPQQIVSVPIGIV